MIEQFKLEYDKNYGYFNRTGWSVVINGIFYVELEKYLFIALIKAMKCYLQAKLNKE